MHAEIQVTVLKTTKN